MSKGKINNYFELLLYMIIYLLFILFLNRGYFDTGIIFTGLLLIFLFSVPQHLFHPFKIVVFVQILPFINFLEKSINQSDFIRIGFLNQTEYQKYLNKSLLIFSLWLISFILGYSLLELGLKTKKEKHNYALRKKLLLHDDKKKIETIGNLFFVLGIFFYFVLIKQNGGLKYTISNMDQRVSMYAGKNYLVRLIRLSTIGSLLILFSGKILKSRITIVVSFLMLTTIGARESAFFHSIFSYLLFYDIFYKSIPKLRVYVLGVAFLYLALLVGNFRQKGYYSNYFESVLSILSLAGKNKNTAEIVPALLFKLNRGDIKFLKGSTFLGVIYGFIPRNIWKSKPTIDETGIVGQAIMGTNSYWGQPPREYGWAYFNFGIVGVIVYGFLAGMVLNKVYNNIFSKSSGSRFYYGLLYSLVSRELIDIFSTSSQMTIILNIFILLVLKYIFKAIKISI